MSARPPIRYDLQPLADAMQAPIQSLARLLNLGGSTWVEYRNEGVSAHVAERLALKAGFHPGNVWVSWYDDELDRLSVECADEKCTERFVPAHHRQTYCTPACQRRARWRRQQATRRARDPEREAARKRRWAEESRDYLRVYKRRWDDEKRDHRNAYAREYRSRSSATRSGGEFPAYNAQGIGPCGEPVNGDSQGSGPTDPQGNAGMVA